MILGLHKVAAEMSVAYMEITKRTALRAFDVDIDNLSNETIKKMKMIVPEDIYEMNKLSFDESNKVHNAAYGSKWIAQDRNANNIVIYDEDFSKIVDTPQDVFNEDRYRSRGNMFDTRTMSIPVAPLTRVAVSDCEPCSI